MASRKEEREKLRVERERRLAESKAAERKRLLLGYGVAGLISLAVLAGIVAVIIGGGDGDGGGGNGDGFATQFGVVPDGAEFDDRDGAQAQPIQIPDLERSAAVAECDLRVDLEDEGSGHFGDEDREADWETNPPTSGDHYGDPSENASGALADGPYRNQPPMSRVLHGLEHGRVAIQYSPELAEEDQLAIKGVFDELGGGLILFPNADMPFAVAATGWTRLIGCESFEGDATVDALRNFIVEFRGRGPEQVGF